MVNAPSKSMKPMKREDVTDLIVFRKMKSGIKWPEIAGKVGQSKAAAGAVQGLAADRGADGRPGEDRDERQVPTVQNLLTYRTS